MNKPANHIGERYGRLTIIGTIHNAKRNRTHYLCKCDCGNTHEAEYTKLKMGKVKSCGCMTIERVEQGRKHEEERKFNAERKQVQNQILQQVRHLIRKLKRVNKEIEQEKRMAKRQANIHLFWVWQKMRNRCSKPKCDKWQNYGGRGIRVCDEWNNDCLAFIDWALSNGYKRGLSIDRIDVNGNYEPRNCRWTDMVTQANNKTTNKLLVKDGVVKTQAQWARELGVSAQTIAKRQAEMGFEMVGCNRGNA